MIVVNSIDDIDSKEYVGIGLTVGNFDGLHLGHQEFIGKMVVSCEQNGLLPVTMSFKPHPVMILRPQENFLINSYEERAHLIEALGVKYLVEFPFNRDVSSLPPGAFLDRHIISNSKVRKLFLGFDFAFGANKSGGHLFIKNYCKDKEITVEFQQQYFINNKAVSSTTIRDSIRSGDVALASRLLDRPFYLSGSVVKGDGRGRLLGFPTANIGELAGRVVPSEGVYVTCTYYQNKKYDSITNVGKNPTFLSSDTTRVETHLFDFDRDVYGEKIKVEFLKKIRDEKKFSSANELVAQIKVDIENAKIFHGQV